MTYKKSLSPGDLIHVKHCFLDKNFGISRWYMGKSKMSDFASMTYLEHNDLAIVISAFGDDVFIACERGTGWTNVLYIQRSC
jgi:hypothetical protein